MPNKEQIACALFEAKTGDRFDWKNIPPDFSREELKLFLYYFGLTGRVISELRSHNPLGWDAESIKRLKAPTVYSHQQCQTILSCIGNGFRGGRLPGEGKEGLLSDEIVFKARSLVSGIEKE